MLPGSSLRVPGSPFCRAWTSMTDQDPEVSVGAFPNRGLVLVGTSLVLVLHREGRTQEPRENDHPIRTTPPWLLLLKERGASEPKGVGGGTCAPPPPPPVVFSLSRKVIWLHSSLFSFATAE